MFKKIGLGLLIMSLIFSLNMVVQVRALDLVTNAASAILLETTSGKILYGKKEHERLFPASMTKMLSMYLVLEAINNGEFGWDDAISVSEHASSIGGSQIWLKPFEIMSVYDLFKSAAIASANDAIVALAEKVAVTEENFANKMNEQMTKWGLSDSHFVNASGLHDPNHYSSAYDMAMIGKHLLEIGQDKLFEFTTKYDAYIREGTAAEVWLVNTNKLLRTFNGTDGLKTGYTSQGGYSITLTANRDGLRLIGVVMKEPSNTIRDQEVKKLLEYGFSLYKSNVYKNANEVIDTISIPRGKPKSVDVYAKEDCMNIAISGNNEQNPKVDVVINDLTLPIVKDSEVGLVTLTSADGVKTNYKLYLTEDVVPLNYVDYLKETLHAFIY